MGYTYKGTNYAVPSGGGFQPKKKEDMFDFVEKMMRGLQRSQQVAQDREILELKKTQVEMQKMMNEQKLAADKQALAWAQRDDQVNQQARADAIAAGQTGESRGDSFDLFKGNETNKLNLDLDKKIIELQDRVSKRKVEQKDNIMDQTMWNDDDRERAGVFEDEIKNLAKGYAKVAPSGRGLALAKAAHINSKNNDVQGTVMTDILTRIQSGEELNGINKDNLNAADLAAFGAAIEYEEGDELLAKSTINPFLDIIKIKDKDKPYMEKERFMQGVGDYGAVYKEGLRKAWENMPGIPGGFVIPDWKKGENKWNPKNLPMAFLRGIRKKFQTPGSIKNEIIDERTAERFRTPAEGSSQEGLRIENLPGQVKNQVLKQQVMEAQNTVANEDINLFNIDFDYLKRLFK